MKKYIICIVILSVCLVGALVLLTYEENFRKDTTNRLHKEILSLYDCNEHQADMSNYVIEHYDDIIAFCGELTADFDYEHDDIEINTDLINKYDLTYFYTEFNSGITVLKDNSVKFNYGILEFDTDSDNIKDDYCLFSFYVKDGSITISTYEYLPYQTGY